MAWFPMRTEHWLESSADRSAVKADPQAYFASRELVVTVKGNALEMLVHTCPEWAMVYEPTGSWRVQDAVVSKDNRGHPSVIAQLDAAGAERLHQLTSRHVDEPLAILIDGYIYSAPLLRSPLGSRIIITGNFTEAEAGALREELMRPSPRKRSPRAGSG
jgi:SecD/SecF fusion protein